MSRTSQARTSDVALGAAILLVAIAASWSGCIGAPFEFDDHESILANPTIRSLASLDWLAPPATGGETVSGRPVLNLSFALNYALGGLDVRGYRAANVLLHAFAALALFGIVRRTITPARSRAGTVAATDQGSRRFALAVALLWALHPLQTGAVTYVVQRAESLAGLFYLLAIYSFRRSADAAAPAAPRRWGVTTFFTYYVKSAKSPGPRGFGPARSAAGRWATASVLASALGMGTKETVATLPIVALLYDRAFVAGSLRAAWRARWKLHVALMATWAVLIPLALANAGRGGSAGPGSAISSWVYFWTQVGAVVRYLGLALWPASQVFDYGVATVGAAAVMPQFVLLVLVAVAAGVALWRNQAVGFLGATFLLLLAPSSSVIPVSTQTMAEHRMYLALAPVLVLACAAIHRLLRRSAGRSPAFFVAVASVVAFGLLTFARNRVYGSKLTLWQDTVAKRPENPRARHNLGLALSKAGRIEEAAVEFRRAIELQPNHAFAHFELGAILLRRREWADAAAQFRAALAADAHHVAARVNLGLALGQLGRTDDAINEYRAALADDPEGQDARMNLAALLAGRGQTAEAEALLRRVIAAAPGQPEAHFHLGLILEETGKTAAAEEELRAAVRLQPDWAQARVALGNLLLRRGDSTDAESCFRDAISRERESVGAQYGLGNVLARQERFAAAADAFREVLRLSPSHVQARNNLANCQLALGRFDDAIANYEAVLRERPGDAAVRRNLEIAREFRATHR